MLVFVAALIAAILTDHVDTKAAVLGAVVLGVLLGLGVLARRHARDAGEWVDVEPTPLDQILPPADDPVPVAHEGATEGWSPAADVRRSWVLPGDPFTADLTDIDLDGAPEYAAMVRRTGVDLGWMSESFTAWWSSLGKEVERTQALPRIEVPA
jgi:hypothetical protein